MILEEGKHFSLSRLVDYINDKYKPKRAKNFSKQNVMNFCRVGRLPDYLGAKKIEVIKNEEIGITVYKIED